jgi:hypothetical protein
VVAGSHDLEDLRDVALIGLGIVRAKPGHAGAKAMRKLGL